MINKYYVRKLKKLIEKNTRYETIRMWDEPTPYILTNAKDYYKIMLCVEKLTDKNDITDGLVDILENRVIEQQKVLDKIKEYAEENKIMGVIAREENEYMVHILKLLEEIE